jgi:alpha-N-arabinofuranosidase
MEAHNTFEAPNALRPVAYNGRSEGGKLTFDLPAKAVAVVQIQ